MKLNIYEHLFLNNKSTIGNITVQVTNSIVRKFGLSPSMRLAFVTGLFVYIYT